jgi:DNA-directed RNA polymerase subunit RPC12/RpoP
VADVVAMDLRRCAWCHRVFTATGWTAVAPAEDDEPAERERETLCPDCSGRLQQRRPPR